MNKILSICLLLATVICGCELDNYDQPSSPLNGRITFGGQPVGIRQGISVLQLYQPGFANTTPINVNVKQDGTFSSMLFDGTYKLVRISGNGPWENNTDTITIEVNGPTSVDVPVTPFFSISDVSFSVEDNVLKATCRVANQVSGRQIERVSLIVGKTILLDDPTKLAPSPADPLSTKAGAAVSPSQPIDLSQNLNLPPISAAEHVYARIAVKTVGATEMIYSEVWQVR
jgi:hypothetical protein